MLSIEEVLSRFEGAVKAGDQWSVVCPCHGDRDPSLTVGFCENGGIGLNCFVGCDVKDIIAAVGLSWSDICVDRDDDGGGGSNSNKGSKSLPVTVSELAAHKKLPEAWLTSQVGIIDGPRGVQIPYRDRAGMFLFRRVRAALRAKEGTYQPKGMSLRLYGQWRHREITKAGYVFLVEGETSTWTLWYHGYPCYGIPGSNGTRTVESEHVHGLERVYVWRDPGFGGDCFVSKLARRLRQDAGFKGEILVASSPEHKDPSELHISVNGACEGFTDQFDKIIAKSVPIDEIVAEINREKAKGKRQEKKVGGGAGGGQQVAARLLIPGIIAATMTATPPAQPPADGSKDQSPQQPPPAPPSATPGNNENMPPPGWYSLSDDGNAQRLIHRFGERMRYVSGWKEWAVWNGRMWATNAENDAIELVKQMVRGMFNEAVTCEDAETRDRILQHAHDSQSHYRVSACEKMARTEISVRCHHMELDQKPFLLNCPNGTIDLETGTLHAHCREDYMTKMCPTEYDPDAECPEWCRFMHQIFQGSEEMVAYVQRLLGYCLTGDTSTHMLLVFHGSGGNGKGTLLNTFLSVMGRNYAVPANADLLIKGRHDRHPAELANLYGKRLVTCQETDDGCRLNESLVKHLTGSDPINARFMRQNPWDFDPTHKLILSTNYRPVIRGTDQGIWRRLRLVPFNVRFHGAGDDKGLKRRLLAESTGILAWAVRGCLEWLSEGENVPQEVLAATGEYRRDEDVVQRFLDECVESRPGGLVNATDLYHAYCEWCSRTNEHHPVSQHRFGKRLVEIGYQKRQTNGTHYEHVALRAAPAGSHEPFRLESLDA